MVRAYNRRRVHAARDTARAMVLGTHVPPDKIDQIDVALPMPIDAEEANPEWDTEIWWSAEPE